MSSSLYWLPPETKEKSLGRALKYRISKKLWGHDGSLSGDPVDMREIDWKEYLQGVYDETSDEKLKEEIELVFSLWEKFDGVFRVALLA